MDGNENSPPKVKENKSYGRTHLGVEAFSSKIKQIDFRPFACNFKGCGKLFKLRHHKTEHERIHTGECPYKCFYCGSLFKRKTHLDRHELLHLGDSAKTFLCPWPDCKSKFTMKCDLDYHFKRHVNPEEHVCVLCSRNYQSKYALANHHKRFHLQLRPFKCDVDGCVRVFCFKAELNFHLRKKHKLDPPSKYMDNLKLLQITRHALKLKQEEGKEILTPSKIIKNKKSSHSQSQHQDQHQPIVKKEPIIINVNKVINKHGPKNKENVNETKILLFNQIKIEPQEENSLPPSIKIEEEKKKKKKEWECRHCHRTFKSRERRQRHKERRQHFTTELIECVLCNLPFKTFKRLGAHIVTHENVKC